MPDPTKKSDDDKNKSTEIDLTKNPAFVQLSGIVSTLGKNMQGLQTLVQGVADSVKTLTTAKPSEKPEPSKKEPTADEINEMSQVELAQHLFNGVRQMLDGFKSEMKESLEKVSNTAEEGRLETQIDKLRKMHKDFDEWIPEMKEKIRNTNGAISLAEAYTLVRHANPDKAKQMDEKYFLEDKPDQNKSDRKNVFGGLTPTSRRSDLSGDDESEKKPLSREEAAEKAWEETFGDVDATLIGENSEE